MTHGMLVKYCINCQVTLSVLPPLSLSPLQRSYLQQIGRRHSKLWECHETEHNVSSLSKVGTKSIVFFLALGNVDDLTLFFILIRYLTGNLLSGSIPGWIKSRDSRQYVFHRSFQLHLISFTFYFHICHFIGS